MAYMAQPSHNIVEFQPAVKAFLRPK